MKQKIGFVLPPLTSRGVFLLLILLLWVLLVDPAVSGADSYDLGITVTPLKTADPGELVTQVFTLSNEGTESDSYDLSLELPEGWSSLGISDQVSLGAGDSSPVFVNVNVPGSASAGRYQVALTAASQADPALEKSQAAEIQVKSVPDLDLEWEVEPRTPGPGQTLETSFVVSNRGNLPDQYSLEVSVPGNWSYTLETESVRVMPGDSRTVEASFTVPDDVAAGERYRLEVTATSAHDRDLTATITDSGSLGPPPPEKVPKSLFPQWRAYTMLNIDQSGDPGLRFGGRGEIPTLGDVSANLNLSTEGYESGRLRVMREHWGMVMNGSSISGSYLGISDTPLFIYENEDFRTRFLFTEENQGVSLEKDYEDLDLRAVLGNDATEDGFQFHELQGSFEFSESVVLDAMISSGETQTESGSVIGGGLELSDDKVEIYPSFSRVYPGYPRRLPSWDVGVNASYDEEEFTSIFSWDYNRTRLDEPPQEYYSEQHNFGVFTSLDVSQEMDLDFSLDFMRRKSDDDPTSNHLRRTSLSSSLSGGEDLSWSVGAGLSRREDLVEDTVRDTYSVDGTVNLTLGDTDHTFSVATVSREGTFGESLTNTFTMHSEFSHVPLSPRFSLRRTDSDTTFSANLSEQTSDDLSLNFSFSTSVVQQDRFSCSLSVFYLEPFRFIGPTKGQVKGYLYLDRGKGDQRTGEGVEGALLVLDDKEAITGEDGQFTFPPVEPGSYLVQIKELEAGLSPQVEFPLTVDVEAGDQIELDVPLRPRSWLRGTVFNDQNENGVRDLGESLLSGVELLVTGEETSRSVRTGANGRFTVDLPPGTYKVELQEDTLPERGEPTTPSVLEIQTEEYGRTEVEFGVYQKPRPVEVTFGPPTAAFSFSPEEPLVGEEVRFDGSDSSAIRVDIERYQWTLSHEDREIQREGGEIAVELDQPGTWEVTLTVVDENGLKNTRVKAFEVREG